MEKAQKVCMQWPISFTGDIKHYPVRILQISDPNLNVYVLSHECQTKKKFSDLPTQFFQDMKPEPRIFFVRPYGSLAKMTLVHRTFILMDVNFITILPLL
jgi:hypothetical protein